MFDLRKLKGAENHSFACGVSSENSSVTTGFEKKGLHQNEKAVLVEPTAHLNHVVR